LEIHDEQGYRDAIAALERLGAPKPGTAEDRKRQDLIAAVEAYAQKGDAEQRKGKPYGSIPTR
jgi:hypothetical protein